MMHHGGRSNNALLSQSWVFQASIASPPPPQSSARAQRNLLFKRTICLLVAAVVFVTCAMHFYPTTQVLIANENCATTITTTNLKKSERLMAIPFEKRLRMLGESLQKINETVTIVPINSGMARLMFNLRCSLKALHVEPVLYFAYDLKIFAYLVDVLEEPFVLYNDTGFHTEKLEYINEGEYNKQMKARLHVWNWVLRDLHLSFWFIDADIFVFKEFRHFADAKYAAQPNSPYNQLFQGVTRLPDIIIQMDHMSKEIDLGSSLVLNERPMPQGCNGFFFMRSTNNSYRFLDDVAHLFKTRDNIHDQEAFYQLIKSDPSYARYLDLNPKHPQSYLHESKKGEPLLLVKYLPQMTFINGHALMKYPPKEKIDFYMVHTNGWRKNKESKLRELNGWKLDDYNQCIT